MVGITLRNVNCKPLTGESEASELIYFKVYKSQAPVIEQALGAPRGRPERN